MQGGKIPETTVVPTTNGEAPPAPRNAPRGLLPSTWQGRAIRLEYTDAHGLGVETSGILLDWCGTGPVFNLAGGRVLVAWDRLVSLGLVGD